MMFPPGDWSFLIIGDQWPDDQDLMALLQGKSNRGQIEAGFTHFADMLRNAQSGPLAQQQGHTADDLRDAFRQGEDQARKVAEKNGVKGDAYGAAHDSMVSLQQDLANLAEEGNQRIKEIQNSNEPVEAKVTQIVAAIHQYRALANISAAKYSGNVFDAMQRVLDAGGAGHSARQFAQAHGLDTGQMFRPHQDDQDLSDRVRDWLNKPDGSTTNITGSNLRTQTNQFPNPAASEPSEQAAGPLTAVGASNLTTNSSPPPGPQPSAAGRASPSNIVSSNLQTPSPAPPSPAAPAAPAAGPMPSTSMMSHGGGSPPGMPSLGGGSSGTPTAPSASLTGAPFSPTGPGQAVTPAELMHSFDKGLQAGAAAGPIPPAQMPTSEPQVPQSPATTPSAGVGVPVTAQAFDSPAPVSHAATPDATPAPSVVAGPAATAGPVAAAPPSPGALPAYASDLRPTAPAAGIPAAPPSLPPSMTPGSAPVHPSAGQGSAGSPTVVRQPTPPPPPSSPSSLGTESVVATATGAAAGAASANATARGRLQRLVSAVARQQPRLAWAAGDRPDNTTVLTTDLASGWIPPGIDLPAAVTLLPAARRRGDLETLLGEVTVAAGYTPIHHIPEDDEPIPTSPRPRHVPEIDELGWELSQATQWRDGLPRLAHTLAKAASGGTGVLDKEVELLREHLAAVGSRVIESYPENVDPHDVGNWQLLAAIDALVAGEKSTATYHLAWFQACSTVAGQADHRARTPARQSTRVGGC